MSGIDIRMMWEPDADAALGLPRYETVGAAGADLRANLPKRAEITLLVGARMLVPTGLRLAIPAGYEVQIRPRSGLALKHGITLPNSPGTIDADYRGPLGVIMMNGGDVPFVLTHGMRIAQMVVAPVLQARFNPVDALEATARGVGGLALPERSDQVLVLIIAAVIWGIGVAMGTPRQARWIMIALLLVMVIVVQLVFPEGHALRAATGGSAAPWFIFSGIGVFVFIYSRFIARLRVQTGADDEPAAPSGARQGSFSETELNRYARHIALREVGGAGQKALRNAKVLVIGAGGLGAPVLQYLAAAGVGTIGVIDDDVVENTNLQRQVIHKDARIGMAKVFSAQAEMLAQNPFVTVKPYHRRLNGQIAPELFAEYDLVLDGTDNFETRYLVNATCVAAGMPLVSGALSQWEGRLSVFDPAEGAPCYACIFPTAPAAHLAPSCSEAGVIGPLPGVVGAMMAVEAIKIITGAGTSLRGQMVIYDALYAESRSIKIAPRDDCPICAHLRA